MSTNSERIDRASTDVRDDTNARIHARLFRAKLTKKALAEGLHLGTTATSRKLNGHASWTLEELVQLSDLLDTSVAYLTGEVDDDTPLRKTRNAPAHESQGVRAASAELVAGAGFEPTTSGL